MIYLFSGLGADSRVFEYLQLDNYPTKVIEWRQPLPTETLGMYAKRLVDEQIDVSPDNVFIGVSFGGIVAQEVARLTQPAAVILISSVKDTSEVPFYYHWFGKLQFDRLVPAGLLTWPTFFTYYCFGVSMQNHKQLLKNILQHTDKVFLKWAIRQILRWQPLQKIENLMHIHGDNDHILPYRTTRNALLIKNGGHLMIVTHGKEISEIINRYLVLIRTTNQLFIRSQQIGTFTYGTTTGI